MFEVEEELTSHEGIYQDQLSPWMSTFPRDQLLVIKSEHFFSDPQDIYNKVLDFLDLSAAMFYKALYRAIKNYIIQLIEN